VIGKAYRPDIDGLRAIAVLAVLGYHAWPSQLPGGYLGVDVFFVISGFLITQLIVHDLRQGRFSFRRFYVRRARRILPALFIVILTALGIGSSLLLAPEFASLGRHAVGATFFAANVLLMSETGYFDAAAETKPLLHLWSLGIEEQFYLTFPLLLWAASRRRVSILGVVASIGGVSWLLHALLSGTYPTAAFYLPVTRAWELMAGAILAAATARPDGNTVPAAGRAALGSLAGTLLLVAAVALVAFIPLPDTLSLTLAVAGTALIIWAGPDALLNRRLLSIGVLVGIGLISYPLYLWHWVLLSFLRIHLGHEGAVAQVPFALALSFALAWATYRFAERPVRAGLVSGRAVAGALVTLGAIVVIAGTAVWAREGLPNRETARVRALAQFAHSPHEPFRDGMCAELLRAYDAIDPDGCRSSSPTPPSIVLLGDSHANQYFNSLAGQLDGTAVLHIGRWSCLPFSSRTHQTEPCQRSIALARKYVLEQPSVSTVVLAGYWAYLMAGRFADSNADYRAPGPLAPAETTVFERTAHEVLTALLASGKRVVLLLDVPNLNFNIQHCVFDPASADGEPSVPPGCDLDRRAFEQRSAPYDRVMAGLVAAHPGLRVFDPRSVLCEDRVCHAMRDGYPLYFDSDHLSRRGTDLVIARLLDSGMIERTPGTK
jgi:peptidoglycan/LPS O-acetylase OafA/YrhL